MTTGFEPYSDEVLRIIEGNLLRGLDRVADSIAAGTFTLVGEKGSAPPCEGGQITLILLRGVQSELDSRL
jgi:hypothetical protein